MEHLLKRGHFDTRDVYPDGSNKERKRADLASSLVEEISVVPPSRLVTLLGQALKWQKHTGQLPAGAKLDVFRGSSPQSKAEAEAPPSHVSATVRFGKESHPECAVFSPDGLSLITGASNKARIPLWKNHPPGYFDCYSLMT